MTTENLTKVIFRRHKTSEEIMAIFPQLPGSPATNSCICYAHIGQHGTCFVNLIVKASVPLSEDEYAPLKKELEDIGYKLNIMKRITMKDHVIRHKENKAINEAVEAIHADA